MVGIEVTQDESVTLGLEEWVECRGEIRGAGGTGRDVDVEDVYWVVVDGGSDCEVFSGGVIGEEGV